MKDLKKILNSERGVALMMVMTAIILLMAIYGEFTFDSKISRLKATNIMDRAQAKLMAESGLHMAMARLKLYKEAFNYIENNQQAKTMVPAQLINQLWEVPFIFPIPVGDGANRAFKDTVKKFSDETLLDGEMKVSIQNISNRMNLNLLRIDMTKVDPNNQQSLDDANNSQLDMSATAISTDVSVDQSLFFLLKKQVDDKKEKDEAFADRNGSLNYQELVTALKYYMSDYQSMLQDPLSGEAEQNFSKIPLSPKYGPMSSASELYAIPGWTDELIELIQNEFSVYPNSQIDFNKISANMLRILLPSLSDDQIKDFFETRDDPETPKVYNSLADFRTYMVDVARIDGTMFDDRMKLFVAKGFSFGSSPNLFKVVSEGSYNRSVYTLVAYVVLPKPAVIGQTPPGSTPPGQTPPGQTPPGQTPPGQTPPGQTPPGGQNQTTQLLDPRIIEIQIN